MIWIVLACVAGLVVYLAFAARTLWRSGKNIGRAASGLGDAVSRISAGKAEPVERPTNVFEDPARVDDAKEDWKRVRDERKAGRRRRLATATGRWGEHTDATWERFGAESKQAAREARARIKAERAAADAPEPGSTSRPSTDGGEA